MLDAAAAFEMALLHGGGMWERATGGLKESLRSFLGAKQQPGGNGAVVLAIGLWRDYFPGEPEPKTAVLAAASTPGSGRPEDVETQATP